MTIRPAVLTVWPQHRDYPIFRYNLIRWKKYFQDIFVCFSSLNQKVNYRPFVIHKLPFAQFFTPQEKRPDWRDDAIHEMLTVDTKADYFLFIEQDFLIKDCSFWEKVLNTESDFIYYKEGERIHPAFALINRELLNKTSLDFAAHPDDGYDHFGILFKEITAIDKGKDLRELGLVERQDFYHMAGLSQNYSCVENGEPLYKPKEFLAYNYLSMLLPNQEWSFSKIQYDIAAHYGCPEKKFPNEELFLKNFFPEEDDE